MPDMHTIADLPPNTYYVRRSDDDINDLGNRLAERIEKGETAFRGKTYEEGVDAATSWLLGMSEDHPIDG